MSEEYRNHYVRSIAGSGLILDPKKAQEDLKLFKAAKDGMVRDV